MKRFLALTLALVLALALAACSGSSVQGMMQDSGSSSAAQDNTPAAPADNTPAAPAAPVDNSYIGRPESEMGMHTDDATYFDGRMGDHMRNVFFEYTVNSAEYPDSYEGYTPSEGYQFVLANVTVKNTFGSKLPMSMYDFQVQWYDGDDSDTDYNYGYQYRYLDTLEENFDYDAEVVVGNMMPEFFDLMPAASVTYDILYEVPANSSEFSISYLEVWDDESEGDVFFVYFEK